MSDFERLELLFRRTGSLPALPSTAVELLKTIDTGEATAASLERIIAADPALSAEFLRMASVAAAGGVPRYSTIRGAIMLLGQRVVRSLAMSLLLRHMSSGGASTPLFDQGRFSRHSLAVGMLARFLFARRHMQGEFVTAWSADEVFAAGLLSSLGIGLLARVSAVDFDRVFMFSKRAGITFEDGFQKIYGHPTTKLTAAAVEAWGLPNLFSQALVYLYEPWACQEEFISLCCLNYAVALTDDHGFGIGDWKVEGVVSPEVELEVGMSTEEQQNLMQAIGRHVEEWVNSSRKAA